MLNTTGDLTARYRYGTYGQKATGTTGNSAELNPFRYLGGFQLNTGWYQFGYRYYEPTWQRFTAPDPTGQEDNTYAYGSGDPVNKSDATGALGVDEVVFGLGIALGVASFVTGGLGFITLAAASSQFLSFSTAITGVASIATTVGCSQTPNTPECT